MQIDIDVGEFNILNEKYLPFSMQGRIVNENNFQAYVKNYNTVLRFLSNRVLPIDRENAKKLLNSLHLSQVQTPEERAKISISYKALSLQDNYWVKDEKQEIKWKDIDLRQNSLNRAVAQIALHGQNLTINGRVDNTPEVSTQGAYAKCWKRDNGKLWLYKRGDHGDKESRVEVEVSRLLDKTNVNHLKYYDASSDGIYCCKCECMSSQDISMLSGDDYILYCEAKGVDWRNSLIRLDPENFYQMLVIDYLISNPDRHTLNWGLFYNCNTMELLGLHLLYDNNNAFDLNLMNNDNFHSHFYDKTMYEVARMALSRCNFKITNKITKSDFYYPSHYYSFVDKASKLGIKI